MSIYENNYNLNTTLDYPDFQQQFNDNNIQLTIPVTNFQIFSVCGFVNKTKEYYWFMYGNIWFKTYLDNANMQTVLDYTLLPFHIDDIQQAYPICNKQNPNKINWFISDKYFKKMIMIFDDSTAYSEYNTSRIYAQSLYYYLKYQEEATKIIPIPFYNHQTDRIYIDFVNRSANKLSEKDIANSFYTYNNKYPIDESQFNKTTHSVPYSIILDKNNTLQSDSTSASLFVKYNISNVFQTTFSPYLRVNNITRIVELVDITKSIIGIGLYDALGGYSNVMFKNMYDIYGIKTSLPNDHINNTVGLLQNDSIHNHGYYPEDRCKVINNNVFIENDIGELKTTDMPSLYEITDITFIKNSHYYLFKRKPESENNKLLSPYIITFGTNVTIDDITFSQLINSSNILTNYDIIKIIEYDHKSSIKV